MLSKNSVFPPEPFFTVAVTGPAPFAETVTVNVSPGATDDLDVLILMLVAANDLTDNAKVIRIVKVTTVIILFKKFFFISTLLYFI